MNQDLKYKKVLVIGIDGMDHKVTNKLMKEGKLPHFSNLAKIGTYANLSTSYPPETPVAWTSIATGSNPAKHGIFDYIHRNPENYMLDLSLSESHIGSSGTEYKSNVRVDPFWVITSKNNIPTTVIRWPVTFPPTKIKGNLLSGLGVPEIKGFLSGYTFYTSDKSITSEKPSNKIIYVEEQDVIKTKIFGPKKRTTNGLEDITQDMKIRFVNIKETIEIEVNNNKYLVQRHKWSDWISVKFNAGLFKSVHAIFKVYLISLKPFNLYMTAVQIDPENPIKDISYPSGYSKDLAEEIGLYYTLGMPEETDGYGDDRLSEKAFIEHINEIETEREKMFWEEFKDFKKGVFAFVFDSSDRFQHMFWDDKVLEDDGGFYVNQALEDYYKRKDDFIGEVLSNLDSETLLLIPSDHGFNSFERAVSINRWLVENGFMVLKEEPEENDDGALFKYVDWSKTKAYAFGFASLCINLKGREKEGIVESREEVVDEIIKKLEELKDKKTGKKVIYSAYKREDVYTGDYMKDAPDIIIGFQEGYRMDWKTALGGLAKDVIYDNTKKWNGDHLMDPSFVPGVLFSNMKIDKKDISQMDVAPTVLGALGIEIPRSMDGKSLLKDITNDKDEMYEKLRSIGYIS